MSNRRRKPAHPWTPWRGPIEQPADERVHRRGPGDARLNLARGRSDPGVMAMLDAFARAGIVAASFGSDPPGYEDKPPGAVVTWWFTATWPDGTEDEGRYGPTADKAYGVLEAGAQILRRVPTVERR